MIFKSEKTDWNDLIRDRVSKGEINLEERLIIQGIVSWLVVLSRIRPTYYDLNMIEPLDPSVEINDRIDRYIPQNGSIDRDKIIGICNIIFETWSQAGDVLERE